MRVVISQRHHSLNEKLTKELNKLAIKFDNKTYSKIENIENTLLKRNISVEKKKKILMEKLHSSIVMAFSIDKSKFNKIALDSLKSRLHNIRKIIFKLRSVNYYFETTFLEDLKLSKFGKISETRKFLEFSTLSKIKTVKENLKEKEVLARGELEALEYSAYQLIGRAVILDKKLLRGYTGRERKIVKKESIDVKDLGSILSKESLLLEHLEAKMPPPKAVSKNLIKEPIFTHWAARVCALMSYLEHLYAKEIAVFSKLKKNKIAKMQISKKIISLIKEKSELLGIMEEKAISMKRFRLNELKKELHNVTTVIAL